MATRPIVQIEVDSSKFDKFFELFQNYSKALDEQPAAWDALNDAMAGAGKALESGAVSSEKSLHKAADEAQRVVFSLRQAGQITASHTRAFNDFGKAGTGAWKAISGAADASMAKTSSGLLDLVKAVAPLEAVAAVLGPLGIAVGAIGGIIAAKKALADVATPRQRSAFGLGTTTGKASSFEIYANQFLGQDALAAAAGNQLSLGSQGQLAVLGIDFNKATRMSPGDLAFEKLKAATTVFKNAAPGTQLQQPGVQAYLALGGHIEDLRNAAAYTPNALAQAQKNVGANAGRLGLNKNAVDSGAALSQSINAAGGTLQALAINKLSGGDQTIAKAINFATGGPSAARDNLVKGFQQVTSAAVHGAAPALHALQKAAEGVTRSFTTPIAGTASAAAIIAAANKAGGNPLIMLADAGHESGMNPRARVRDFYSDGSFAGYSTGLFMLNDNGMGHGMSIKDMMNPSINATVMAKKFASIEKAHPHWSPGQIAFAAEGPAAGPGGTWKTAYINDVNERYNKLANQMRNARPPAITVKVSNPTQSRVAVSINAAALTSQF